MRSDMDDVRTAATILRRLAELLERSSPQEVHALLKGVSRLTVAERTGSKQRPGKRRVLAIADLPALAGQLRERTTREEGLALLEEREMSKAELERLARVMDLPVTRDDNAEKLRDRIIEAAIGFRLRSQAIRGERKG